MSAASTAASRNQIFCGPIRRQRTYPGCDINRDALPLIVLCATTMLPGWSGTYGGELGLPTRMRSAVYHVHYSWAHPRTKRICLYVVSGKCENSLRYV